MELWQSLVLYAIVGLAAGVLSGFFGIGGGVIIVPALVFIFGLSQHQAQGTSLAVFALPVGLIGAYTYWKEGSVVVPGALVLAAGIFIGSYFGASRAVVLPEDALRRAFAIVLIIVALRMFFTRG
ncbi:MAG: UPF0721 transmembrane protein [Armatimonadota bacterium]|nr:MAG: UPF0721 transmembrane protein [Armatimonadota bacterium]